MKKQYTVVCRTKAEYNSNGAAATIAPQNFATLSAAKNFMRTSLNGGSVSTATIFGPGGIEFKGRNPSGA